MLCESGAGKKSVGVTERSFPMAPVDPFVHFQGLPRSLLDGLDRAKTNQINNFTHKPKPLH
jgi:hypothetical protein